MTIAVANTQLTNTYDYWRNRTNDLAYIISTYAVTTESNTAAGNAAITGTFTANNLNVNNSVSIGNSTVNVVISSTTSSLTANSGTFLTLSSNTGSFTSRILVGNSTVNTVINSSSLSFTNSTSGIIIPIPTAAQISANNYYLNANGTWGTITIVYSPISNGQVTTTGLTVTTIDTFNKSTYGSAEYVLNVKDNNANNYYSAKVLVTHDTGVAYITEYASLITNNNIGSFSAAVVSSDVILSFTPLSSNTTVKFVRAVV